MVQFENEDIPIIEQKESIKLSKMSKGYNWEIKLLGNPISDETLNRLEELNKKLSEKYGGH